VPLRSRTLSVLAACAAAAASLTVLAPGASAAEQRPAARHAPATRLTPLLEPAALRLELADKVAAAKWGTDKPVEDPARERQVLADVAERAHRTGVDPGEATAFFRDQIEAGKTVQRGLYARWRAHPAERPTERPDLDKEVRPALDRLTVRLLHALKETGPLRHDPRCAVRLPGGLLRTAYTHRFDGLHGVGLLRAAPSVCRGAGA